MLVRLALFSLLRREIFSQNCVKERKKIREKRNKVFNFEWVFGFVKKKKKKNRI